MGTHTERRACVLLVCWKAGGGEWGGWRRVAWSSGYLKTEQPSALHHSYCGTIQLWMSLSFPLLLSLSVSFPGCCCLISVGINLPACVSQTSAQSRLVHSWRHSRSISTPALGALPWQVTPVSSALTAVLLEVAEVAAGSIVTSDSRGEWCWIMSWPRCFTSGCPAGGSNRRAMPTADSPPTGPRLLLKLHFTANYCTQPLSRSVGALLWLVKSYESACQ